VKKLIPISDYAIDFAVKKDSVLIIEINPPAPLAGTGFFEWPAEREILQNGPFEFRIRTKPLTEGKERIYSKARDLINSKFPNYFKLEQKITEEKQKARVAEIEKQYTNSGTELSDEGPSPLAVAITVLGFAVVSYGFWVGWSKFNQ